MAHKKAGGSSRNGRDTAGRRLGVKKFGGGGIFSRLSKHATSGSLFPSTTKLRVRPLNKSDSLS